VGNLTIRNLDNRVIEQLKAQARANQRSLEGEIRFVLTERVDRGARIADFRERTRRLAAMTADVPQTDSVTLLREDRKR
jgi:plasmid stability protein